MALFLPLYAQADDVSCSTAEEPASFRPNKAKKLTSKFHAKSVEARSGARQAAVAADVYPAQIIAVHGQVWLVGRESANLSEAQALGEGMPLYLNDVIETSAKSFMSLRFGDGSINVLPPNAKIRLGQVSNQVARVELLKGEVQSRVIKSPNAKKNTFEIRLPTASIGVRGTYFRVALTDMGGRVEVEDGVVKVVRRNQCVTPLTLTAGQGAYVERTNPSVTTLLEAPELLLSEQAQRSKDRMSFKLNAVDGAVRYRIEIAQDAAFVDLRQEVFSNTTEVNLLNDGLPDGFYFARVSAIDASGIEGKTQVHVVLRNRENGTTRFPL